MKITRNAVSPNYVGRHRFNKNAPGQMVAFQAPNEADMVSPFYDYSTSPIPSQPVDSTLSVDAVKTYEPASFA